MRHSEPNGNYCSYVTDDQMSKNSGSGSCEFPDIRSQFVGGTNNNQDSPPMVFKEIVPSIALVTTDANLQGCNNALI